MIGKSASKAPAPYERSKGVLILKSLPHNLVPAENFLRHRGWHVFSTHDLNQASHIMIQSEPMYVFISVDHPNPRALVLLKMVRDRFPFHMVAFSENTYASSTQKLSALESKYKLYAPVSGPSLERTVLSILKEQEVLYPSPTTSTAPKLIHAHSMDETASMIINNALNFVEEATQEVISAQPSTDATTHNLTGLDKEWHDAEERYEFTETVHHGIREGADQEPAAVTLPVGKVSEVACFEIISSGLNGYLVIASHAPEALRSKIVLRVAERLDLFLRKRSQGLRDEERMRFQIRPVEFKPWAQSYSIMMQKSIHTGSEMVAAFFPRAENEFEFDVGPQQMIQVSVADIQVGKPVDFDLHIFLEKNQKMIKYTPKGGILYLSQKQRLRDKGLTHFYVDPNARFELRKYRAQSVLDHSISDFLRDKEKEMTV